jgi:hypothetical protein
MTATPRVRTTRCLWCGRTFLDESDAVAHFVTEGCEPQWARYEVNWPLLGAVLLGLVFWGWLAWLAWQAL